MTTRASSYAPLSLRRQLKKYLFLSTGLLLFALALGAAVDIAIFDQQIQLQEQTVAVQTDTDGMLSSMVDQETGLRGYIITNQMVFLGPFNEGRQAYTAYIQDLHAQFQNNAFKNTSGTLTEAEAAASLWYTAYARPQIARMQNGQLALARNRQTTVQGNAFFDRFRAVMAHLQQSVKADVEAAEDRINLFNSVLLGGAIILSLSSIWFLWYMIIRFTRPLMLQLTALKRASELVGAGEATTRVELLAYEELNQVGQAFNTMTQVLQEKQEVLQQIVDAAEEQNRRIQDANSTMRAVFDSTSEAMLVASPDGYVINVNRSLLEAFSLQKEEVIQRSLMELVLQELHSFRLQLAAKQQILSVNAPESRPGHKLPHMDAMKRVPPHGGGFA